MGRIIGNAHFAHIQSQEDVVGEYTAALEYKLMVFIDECAMGGGNIKLKNTLKNLVTGATQRDRKMHKDPSYQNSYCNLFMASNYVEQMVPAEERARRFECYHSDVKPLLEHPCMKPLFPTQADYFSFLYKSMDYDTIKTFANFLYHMSPYLNNWTHNVPLESTMLGLQKLNNMEPIATYWHECIKEGTLDTSRPDIGWPGLGARIAWKTLHLNFTSKFQESKKIKIEEFKMKLQKYLPKEASSGYLPGKLDPVLNVPSVEECEKALFAAIPGLEAVSKGNLDMLFHKKKRMEETTEEELKFHFIPKDMVDPLDPLQMKIPCPELLTKESHMDFNSPNKNISCAKRELEQDRDEYMTKKYRSSGKLYL